MIEQLVRTIKEANAQHIQLIIRPDGDNNATVIVNTVLQPTSKSESSEALKLRAALATPIVLSGDIGELDVEFTQEFTQFSDTFVGAAQTHSSMLDTKAKIEQAQKNAQTKQAKKSQSSSQAAITAPTVEPEKTSTDSSSNNNHVKQTDFESDQAESL